MRHGYRKLVKTGLTTKGKTMRRRGFFKAIGAALFGGVVAKGETAQDVEDSLKALKQPVGMTLTSGAYADGATGWLSVADIRRLESRRQGYRRRD